MPTDPKTRNRPSLVLMGLRGSGKSTLGQLVASRLEMACVDLDTLTTSLLGDGTLAELWTRLGEPAFRKAEAIALHQSLDRARSASTPTVIALGGGTPTAPGAGDTLRHAVSKQHIFLVYLRGQPETLRARLAKTSTDDRPTLTGAGTLAEIEAVFQSRDGLYRELASHVIEIDGYSTEELVDALCELL